MGVAVNMLLSARIGGGGRVVRGRRTVIAMLTSTGCILALSGHFHPRTGRSERHRYRSRGGGRLMQSSPATSRETRHERSETGTHAASGLGRMSDEELAKDLGPVSALTIGVGTMIGAGIFVLPREAAIALARPSRSRSSSAAHCAGSRRCRRPNSARRCRKPAAATTTSTRALGPLFGSIAGLGDWMGLAFASAFYSIGFGQYLAVFVPLPEVAFLNPIQIGALIAGAIFVAVNYIGAKETGGVQTVIVLILLSILTVFAVAGFFALDSATLAGRACTVVPTCFRRRHSCSSPS